jgi:hypothetical protein
MGSALNKRLYHRRHHDWEAFDEVRIRTVDRYKTSELSGDEWRISAVVEFWFKGHVVFSKSFRNVKQAALHLTSLMDDNSSPIPDVVLEMEKTMCDQPGCGNLARRQYKFKRIYDSGGHLIDAGDVHLDYYTKFCERHKRRGDGGREDNDDNYEEVGDRGQD